MRPSCWQNKCDKFGYQKAFDGGTQSDAFWAITENATNPAVQFDLGSTYTVTAVWIVSRTDCCLDQNNNIDVYVSMWPGFGNGTVCAQNVVFSSLGNNKTISCPSMYARYVSIVKRDTNFLNLVEVKIFGIGKTVVAQYSMSTFQLAATRAI